MENAKEIVPIIDPFQALNTWKEAVTNHFNCNHRELMQQRKINSNFLHTFVLCN